MVGNNDILWFSGLYTLARNTSRFESRTGSPARSRYIFSARHKQRNDDLAYYSGQQSHIMSDLHRKPEFYVPSSRTQLRKRPSTHHALQIKRPVSHQFVDRNTYYRQPGFNGREQEAGIHQIASRIYPYKLGPSSVKETPDMQSPTHEVPSGMPPKIMSSNTHEISKVMVSNTQETSKVMSPNIQEISKVMSPNTQDISKVMSPNTQEISKVMSPNTQEISKEKQSPKEMPPSRKMTPTVIDTDPHHDKEVYKPYDYHYDHPYESYDYIHHTEKPTTTPPPTTPAPVVGHYRVGFKLYYIPLYAGMAFVAYVLVLIFMSIRRHKGQVPYDFLTKPPARMLSDDIAERVIRALEASRQRYSTRHK